MVSSASSPSISGQILCQETLTNDLYMASNDAHDTIQCRPFENVISNHCPLHELDTAFICIPECYKENDGQ